MQAGTVAIGARFGPLLKKEVAAKVKLPDRRDSVFDVS